MPRPGRGTVEIVKRKDGLRTFWVRLTMDGRRNRVRLGTDRDGWTAARAQVELEEQIKAVRAGTWTRPEPPAAADESDPTFRMFASSWLEDSTLEWRPSTLADIKWRLESHVLPHVGEERLSTFDIPRVTAVKMPAPGGRPARPRVHFDELAIAEDISHASAAGRRPPAGASRLTRAANSSATASTPVSSSAATHTAATAHNSIAA